MKSRLAAFSTAFGLFCLTFAAFLFWQRTTPSRLSFDLETSLESEKKVDALGPKVLVIKDLDIRLPISLGEIGKERWGVLTKGVSYLSTSPIPGKIGNSILYGHNWPNLLGNLVNIKPGQEVAVLFNDGSIEKFVIKTTQVVSPKQADILGPSDDRRITLYTCTGFLDRKRFVVVAQLQPK